MKLIILIPCMDMVHTAFMRSLLMLNTVGHDVTYGISSGSLIYDSRNKLLETAKKSGADSLLWVDSDMDLPMNTIQQLSADIDAGCAIVSGLCFKRKPPYTPCIYKQCEIQQIGDGKVVPLATIYEDYPKHDLFEVEAHGGACVMMTMEAVERITKAYGPYPYIPVGGFGEDLSFCMRARAAGIKLYCDSRIRPGHVGLYTYTEADYDRHGSS